MEPKDDPTPRLGKRSSSIFLNMSNRMCKEVDSSSEEYYEEDEQSPDSPGFVPYSPEMSKLTPDQVGSVTSDCLKNWKQELDEEAY